MFSSLAAGFDVPISILRGFMRLGQLAHEVDVEQPVDQAGVGHADIVGELEAALEVARGDAAVQVVLGLLRVLLLAGHDELVLARLDRDVGLAEARDRHGDGVGVLRRGLDIVGRVGHRAFIDVLRMLEHLIEAIEADHGAEKGREIEGGHVHILLGSDMRFEGPPHGRTRYSAGRPEGPPDNLPFGDARRRFKTLETGRFLGDLRGCKGGVKLAP